MTAIRLAAFETFLRKPDPAIAAVLIYGEEADTVREQAARAVARIAGATDDPFSVMTLQDADLSRDPGRLADEVQSLSMFGGGKAVWIKGADQAFLKSAAPLLDGALRGNLVVAEAGPLGKSSPLRTAFEKSPHALALPLYEAESGEIAALVEQILGQDKLRIGHEAIHRFVELTGTSRGLARREAEKLALYCLGGTAVAVGDVEAVCGNDFGASPDDLADSVFSGDVGEADRFFEALVQGGGEPSRLISAVHAHAMRLQDLKLAIDKGAPAEQALRSARPPIFFRRHNAIHAQLRNWTAGDLLTAGRMLGAAVQAARLNGDLARAIAGRCLLSLARKGLQLRSRG